jgi:hypothetical protein
MEPVQSFLCNDRLTKDDLYIAVRAALDVVGLFISLSRDGDIDIFLSPNDCLTLQAALNQAREIAEQKA